VAPKFRPAAVSFHCIHSELGFDAASRRPPPQRFFGRRAVFSSKTQQKLRISRQLHLFLQYVSALVVEDCVVYSKGECRGLEEFLGSCTGAPMRLLGAGVTQLDAAVGCGGVPVHGCLCLGRRFFDAVCAQLDHLIPFLRVQRRGSLGYSACCCPQECAQCWKIYRSSGRSLDEWRLRLL